MKKITLIILMLVMLVSVFSGCAGRENEEKTNELKVTVAPEKEEKVDDNRPTLLKNPNVTLPGEYPICVEMETLSLAIGQSPNVTSYEYGKNFQTTWMQDKFNVKFDLMLFPEGDEGAQKMELLIAGGGELPDIIDGLGVQKDAIRYSYGEAGYLIPLNEYFEQLSYHLDAALESEFNDPNLQDYIKKDELLAYIKSPDGNIYAMPEIGTTLPNSYSFRSWINLEWIEALNLELPTTTDELVTVLTAFRDDDPNGNGKKDEIPMISSEDGWNTDPIALLLNAFVPVSTLDATKYYYTLNDGIIDVPFDKEEWREGLRFIKGLVDEGLLSDLSFTQDYSQYKAMVSAEESIVGIGVSGSISGFGDNKPIYGATPAIEGPNGAKYATYKAQLPEPDFAITSACESPELAFRLMDSGYDMTDDFSMIARYGEPGVDWAYTTEGTCMFADLGYKPLFKNINNIWGTNQQKHWETHPIPQFRSSKVSQGQTWDGDQSNNEYKNSLAVKELYDFVPSKDQVIYKIIYTNDEYEQWNEPRSVLKGYIQEVMVLFVLGSLDLDKDWDSYLNELEKIGYKELIAADQAAYDRTMGR